MNARLQTGKYLTVAELKQLLIELPESATICVGDTDYMAVNVKSVYYDNTFETVYLEGWCQDVCEKNLIWTRSEEN